MAEREEKSDQKLYSAKEKWDILIGVNPLLAEFKEN